MFSTSSVFQILSVILLLKYGECSGSYTFGYEDQKQWSGDCQDNTGHQSPIDIIAPETTTDMDSPLILPAKSNNVTMEVTTNAHGLKIAFAVESDKFDLSVPTNLATTTALQLHLHWNGSEHLVGGERFAVEAHLVTSRFDHMNEDHPKYTVLGRLFKLGDANTVIERMLHAKEQSIDLIEEFDFSELYPDTIDNVFTYSGSFTTPPCTEGVDWIVVEEPLSISKEQVERLQALTLLPEFSLPANYREVQDLNGREITRYNLLGSGAASLKASFLCVVLAFTISVVS